MMLDRIRAWLSGCFFRLVTSEYIIEIYDIPGTWKDEGLNLDSFTELELLISLSPTRGVPDQAVPVWPGYLLRLLFMLE